VHTCSPAPLAETFPRCSKATTLYCPHSIRLPGMPDDSPRATGLLTQMLEIQEIDIHRRCAPYHWKLSLHPGLPIALLSVQDTWSSTTASRLTAPPFGQPYDDHRSLSADFHERRSMRVRCARHVNAFAWEADLGGLDSLCCQCIVELLQQDAQDVLRISKCAAVRCVSCSVGVNMATFRLHSLKSKATEIPQSKGDWDQARQRHNKVILCVRVFAGI
jgi:hypothetical protein